MNIVQDHGSHIKISVAQIRKLLLLSGFQVFWFLGCFLHIFSSVAQARLKDMTLVYFITHNELVLFLTIGAKFICHVGDTVFEDVIVMFFFL